MATLKSSVGAGGDNSAEDLWLVRDLLTRHRDWLGGRRVGTGGLDSSDIEAIKAFQRNACALLNPDGRVDPGGFTFARLSMPFIEGPKSRVFLDLCWSRAVGLQESDYSAAAKALGCEVAAIKAVVKVEVSSRGAFDSSMGRPTILYERHYFRRLTGGKFDRSHPDLSGPQGGYGRYSEQFPKLQRAAMLDEAAALKSASWGGFQIMGANFSDAGFPSVESFVEAMNSKIQEHLNAFVSFIKANAKLHTAIKAKDWVSFAKHYNGPNYAQNSYDAKLDKAYKELVPSG